MSVDPPDTPKVSKIKPTSECRRCGVDATDEFCGNCGTRTVQRSGAGPDWLRRTAYAAADESLVRPALITTLFPRLPKSDRNPFRVAFLGVVVLMLGIALAGWQAPLIGIVALGLLLVFVAYLRATNATADLSWVTVLVTAGLAGALGVAWALGTEAAIARESDDILGIPVDITRVALTGVAIPLSFVICLLVPTMVVRLWRRGSRESLSRESLDGFMIGALSAYCFTSAITLAQLVPEFTAGLDPDDGRSTSGLVVAAAIQGLVIPVTAAALAGAIGATLWFSPRHDTTYETRWYAPTSTPPWIAFTIAAYLGLEALDDLSVSDGLATVVYVALAVVSVCILRVVLHSTLLHESVGQAFDGHAFACPQCGDTVDDQPFCPRCGVAAHAASRTSRVARHGGTGPARSRSPLVLWLSVGIAMALVAGGSIALADRLAPVPPNYVCPPDCGRPPISTPVATNPRFTPDDGEFSVSYPGPGTAYQATFEPNGVVLDLLVGDGGTMRLFGQPAEGKTPKEIAKELIDQHYPGAKTDYEIPNASVGYQLGYGEIADVFDTDSIADESRNRVLVMVAVKNDFALVAAAAAPFREFSPDFGSGHPSGANFFLALDMGKYVNSFTWRGDPPR